MSGKLQLIGGLADGIVMDMPADGDSVCITVEGNLDLRLISFYGDFGWHIPPIRAVYVIDRVMGTAHFDHVVP